MLPTEQAHFTQEGRERRLATGLPEVPVKQNMKVEVPEEVFGVKKWTCTVRSNDNVATFIKELVLELPEGENVNFRAGDMYSWKHLPQVDYKSFEIEEQYRGDWDKFNLWQYKSIVKEPLSGHIPWQTILKRRIVKFNIRIASPPPGRTSPGQMSSYVFGLKPGDKIDVYRPFGEFFAKKLIMRWCSLVVVLEWLPCDRTSLTS